MTEPEVRFVTSLAGAALGWLVGSWLWDLREERRERKRDAAQAEDFRRYTYLSSDQTRTDTEDAEMMRLRKSLTDAGVDLGLPPVAREP